MNTGLLASGAQARYRTILRNVYMWMTIGLSLTAYDTQMIKRMSDDVSADVGESDFIRLSIIGALKLYLDFINMFLFLLRIFGRRR